MRQKSGETVRRTVAVMLDAVVGTKVNKHDVWLVVVAKQNGDGQ